MSSPTSPATPPSSTSSAARRSPTPTPSSPRVVVASALRGVTDALVDVAERGAAGDAEGARAAVERLTERHRGVADARAPALPPEPGGALADVAVESPVPEAPRGVPRDRGDVMPRRVSVRVAEVDAASPFASRTGTDNQFVFTTRRYRDRPLVITGPGAGPAVSAAGVLNDVLAFAGAR